MDAIPDFVPDWLKFLVVYGPLGIWVAWAEWKAYQGRKDAREAAKEHQALVAAAVADQSEACRTAIKEMVERFAVATSASTAAIAAQAEDHRGQIRELTDRFVTLSEDMTKQSIAAIAAARGSRVR